MKSRPRCPILHVPPCVRVSRFVRPAFGGGNARHRHRPRRALRSDARMTQPTGQTSRSLPFARGKKRGMEVGNSAGRSFDAAAAAAVRLSVRVRKGASGCFRCHCEPSQHRLAVVVAGWIGGAGGECVRTLNRIHYPRPSWMAIDQFRNVGQPSRTCLNRGPAPTTTPYSPITHPVSTVKSE